ncbi:4Fe-4S binding protein [Candidatus Hydrogenedentota bacterium]
MRLTRRIVQTLSLALFLWLFIRTADPVSLGDVEGVLKAPVDVFVRMSPFLGAVTMFAARGFIIAFVPAIIVLLTTVFLGRVFCGWICPWGTTLDITDRLVMPFRKRFGRKPDSYPVAHGIRMFLLVACLVAALFGVQMAGWFDPLSMAVRTYTVVIYSFTHFAVDQVIYALLSHDIFSGSVRTIDSAVRDVGLLRTKQPVFLTQSFILLTFVLIVLLGIRQRRFWCRHICPLGALLDVVSRFGILRRRISEKCSHCLKCQRRCKMGAIEDAGKMTSCGDCIKCYTCEAICPQKAIDIGFATPPHEQLRRSYAMSRRGFLAASGVGLLAAPAIKLNPASAQGALRVVRPPGVENEAEFLSKCVRCGECMKVCPNNALHPAMFESGFEGLLTPRFVARIGYCSYDCTLCGQVCPTGAIRELSIGDPDRTEKHNFVMGTAFFNKSRCIPWAEHRDCTVCEEHCPVSPKAIVTRKTEVVDPAIGGMLTVKMPYVIKTRCTGCGICENKCPLRGESAILVGSRQGAVTMKVDESG